MSSTITMEPFTVFTCKCGAWIRNDNHGHAELQHECGTPEMDALTVISTAGKISKRKGVKLIDCGDDGSVELLPYLSPTLPYWNDLVAGEESGGEADGNVKKPTLRYGQKVCECGAEAVYGKDAPHSTWCPKSKAELAPFDREDSCV